jgi:hypothetical protein
MFYLALLMIITVSQAIQKMNQLAFIPYYFSYFIEYIYLPEF